MITAQFRSRQLDAAVAFWKALPSKKSEKELIIHTVRNDARIIVHNGAACLVIRAENTLQAEPWPNGYAVDVMAFQRTLPFGLGDDLTVTLSVGQGMIKYQTEAAAWSHAGFVHEKTPPRYHIPFGQEPVAGATEGQFVMLNPALVMAFTKACEILAWKGATPILWPFVEALTRGVLVGLHTPSAVGLVMPYSDAWDIPADLLEALRWVRESADGDD